MPALHDWPVDGQMTYNGARYKLKNRTREAFPYVVRHQSGLSMTALLLQLDLLKHLDRSESAAVPGRIAPKGYIV